MNAYEKQGSVIKFIKQFIAKNGYSPTVREIASGLKIKSPTTVQEILKILVADGIISMSEKKSRTIELLIQNEYLCTNKNTVLVPVLDKVDNYVTKDCIEIPTLMIEGHEQENVAAYKLDKIIYIVDKKSLIKNNPSLIYSDDKFYIEEKPEDNIFGNIISEIRIY